MARALEHICRMRGGAQAHLMRCEYKGQAALKSRSDGYFVVKFQNNPQHVRILANELLSARLADHLGLPVPPAEQVEVWPEVVAETPDLRIELPRGSEPCAPGLQFGSQFPGDPRTTAVFDFVPDQTLDRLANRAEFAGMLIFDQWTCNTNGRQAVFVRQPSAGDYRALMIDQGFCFNDGQWSFPDAPLRGLYLRPRVYAGVTGWSSFEPWLERVRELESEVLDRAARELPVEWYCGDQEGLDRLLEMLYRRRRRVPELIQAARRSSANPFPNWRG